MKEFKKFSIEFAIIVAIFLAADYIIGTALDKTCAFRDFPSSFRNIPEADYDMVIMGGSRAQSSYDIKMLQDSLGLSIYDYGLSGQNVYTDYGLLNYYIKEAKVKPKVILWDIWATSFLKSENYDIQPIKRLNSVYLQNDTIRSLINLQGKKEEILLNTFHLYKHNSNIPYYLLYSINGASDPLRGYKPLYNIWSDPIEKSRGDRGNFDEQKIEFFKRFIDCCKEEGIYLVFSISPSYYLIENTNPQGLDWAKFACDYVEEKGFTAINYEQDSTFLQHPVWFYNSLHINKDGSEEYTKIVIPYLKRVIN